MKILAITQARVSSTRLPKKVLLPVGNTTILGLHLKRLKLVKKIDQLIVAAADEEGSNLIQEIAELEGISFIKGSASDVLDRFYQAAKFYKADIVVRVTSDCPLIDPFYVDSLIENFLAGSYDYGSNCLIQNLPDGLDAEIMKFSALEKAWNEAKLKSEREHVTPYIWKNTDIKGGSIFKGLALDYGLKLQDYRVTVDELEDYKLIQMIVKNCGENVGLQGIISFLNENEHLRSLNKDKVANAGYLKSISEDE